MEGDREAKKSGRQKAEQYQKILESLHEGYLLVNQSGDIKEVNPAYCRLMGYSRQELLSMNLTDLRSDISSEQLKEVLARLSEGQSRNFESRHRKKDGTILTLNVSAAAIKRDGNILVAGLMWDITEQKKAHRQLKNSKKRFQSLFDNNPNPVFHLNLKGGIERANDAFADLAGYRKAELQQINFVDLVVPEQRQRVKRDFKTIIQGNTLENEIKGLTKDGSHVLVQINSFPVTVEGETVGVFGIAQDITEIRKAEKKLAETQQRFESLFRHNPHSVYYMDMEGNYKGANTKMEALTGYSREELLELNFTPLVTKRDLERTREHFEKAALGEIRKYEIRGITKKGIEKPIRVTNFPMIVDDEIIGVFGIAEDITEQIKAQKKLRESEQKWQRLVKNSPQPIQVVNEKAQIVLMNQAGADLYGYDTPEELIGKSILSFNNDQVKQQIKRRIKLMIKGDPVDHYHEHKITKKNGEQRMVEVNSSPINYQGKKAVQSVYHDITDRQKREIMIEDSLQEKEVMLQEIHHRVKNNMAVISGLLELQALNTTDEHLQGLLKESQMRIHSMAMIHEKLYASQSLAQIPFAEYTKELVQVIMDTIGDIDKNVTVRYRMDSGVLNINQAIPCGLILNELVTNCYKHAFKKQHTGTIFIGFMKKEAEVTLTVEDNGAGLPAGFDLKQEDGLGMNIIRTLTHQLEGEVNLYETDEPGGTCAMIRFTDENEMRK